MESVDHQYPIALFFGAAIVFVFAWEQFNRASYENSNELIRLRDLMQPSMMRNRTIYWRAYVFYAVTLTIIYFILCTYSGFLLPAIGLDLPGVAAVGAPELPSSAVTADRPLTGYAGGQALSPNLAEEESKPLSWLQSDPSIPLFVSLVMVGLAPSVPFLQRAENRIRLTAHRLSGIPTKLIAGAKSLRSQPLNLLEGSSGTLVIPQQDWDRLAHYRKAAEEHPDETVTFRDDIETIIAFKSWVLDGRLKMDAKTAKSILNEVEAVIQRRVNRLIKELDDVSDFERGIDTSSLPRLTGEQSRARWAELSNDTAAVSFDVRVLVMLYVEHGVLPTEGQEERFGWAAAGDENTEVDEKKRQAFLAQRKLVDVLTNAAIMADRESLAWTLWIRATVVVVSVAFLFGLFIGVDSVDNRDWNRVLIAFGYFTTAIITYALALYTAIATQQAAYENGSWRNIFASHWIFFGPQLVSIAFFSGLASVICIVANNILSTVSRVGWETVIENWQGVLIGAISFEGPRALNGIMLGLLVVAIIDAWRDDRIKSNLKSLFPIYCGVAMFISGAVSRMLAGQVLANVRNEDYTVMGDLPRVLETGGLAALIGAAVGIVIMTTLVVQFEIKDSGETTDRKTPGLSSEPAE